MAISKSAFWLTAGMLDISEADLGRVFPFLTAEIVFDYLGVPHAISGPTRSATWTGLGVLSDLLQTFRD